MTATEEELSYTATKTKVYYRGNLEIEIRTILGSGKKGICLMRRMKPATTFKRIRRSYLAELFRYGHKIRLQNKMEETP